MANNCYNFATFTGSEEAISKLFSKLSQYNSCIGYTEMLDIIGAPDREKTDVYDDMGTKWFEMMATNDTPTDIQVSGDSAWSPPLGFYKQICIAYNVSVYAEYEECGNDFGGWYECSADGIEVDRCTTYFKFCLENDRNFAIENILQNIDGGCYESEEDISEELSLLDPEEQTEIKEALQNYLQTNPTT